LLSTEQWSPKLAASGNHLFSGSLVAHAIDSTVSGVTATGVNVVGELLDAAHDASASRNVGGGALPATDSAPLWLLALALLGTGLVVTSRRRGVSGG